MRVCVCVWDNGCKSSVRLCQWKFSVGHCLVPSSIIFAKLLLWIDEWWNTTTADVFKHQTQNSLSQKASRRTTHQHIHRRYKAVLLPLLSLSLINLPSFCPCASGERRELSVLDASHTGSNDALPYSGSSRKLTASTQTHRNISAKNTNYLWESIRDDKVPEKQDRTGQLRRWKPYYYYCTICLSACINHLLEVVNCEILLTPLKRIWQKHKAIQTKFLKRGTKRVWWSSPVMAYGGTWQHAHTHTHTNMQGRRHTQTAEPSRILPVNRSFMSPCCPSL